jgi:hypothetical protein
MNDAVWLHERFFYRLKIDMASVPSEGNARQLFIWLVRGQAAGRLLLVVSSSMYQRPSLDELIPLTASSKHGSIFFLKKSKPYQETCYGENRRQACC